VGCERWGSVGCERWGPVGCERWRSTERDGAACRSALSTAYSDLSGGGREMRIEGWMGGDYAHGNESISDLAAHTRGGYVAVTWRLHGGVMAVSWWWLHVNMCSRAKMGHGARTQCSGLTA
jgi:hypothetical protein